MSISPAEYSARLAALQGQLDMHDIDVALLTDEANIAYYTGYMPEHFFLSRSRMVALIVQATGNAQIIAPTSHLRDIADQSHIPSLHSYDNLRHAPIEQIRAELARSAPRRIGMEMGQEQRINMTLADLDSLRRMIAAPCIDISTIVWQQRLVKSAAELALMEVACRIGEEAWVETVTDIQAGETERDLAARLAAAVASRGGHVAFLIVTSGPGAYYRSNGAPRDRILHKGDFVYVDLGVRYEGYHADFNRNVVVGNPDAAQVARQNAVKAISEHAARYLTPDQPASTVYHRVLADCRVAGLPITPPGRIGHGLGLGVTEPPHISAEETIILSEGMVTSIEPMIEQDDALYCAECLFVVTAQGGRLLNSRGSELFRTDALHD